MGTASDALGLTAIEFVGAIVVRFCSRLIWTQLGDVESMLCQVVVVNREQEASEEDDDDGDDGPDEKLCTS